MKPRRARLIDSAAARLAAAGHVVRRRRTRRAARAKAAPAAPIDACRRAARPGGGGGPGNSAPPPANGADLRRARSTRRAAPPPSVCSGLLHSTAGSCRGQEPQELTRASRPGTGNAECIPSRCQCIGQCEVGRSCISFGMSGSLGRRGHYGTPLVTAVGPGLTTGPTSRPDGKVRLTRPVPGTFFRRYRQTATQALPVVSFLSDSRL